jgi:hypothetical protein
MSKLSPDLCQDCSDAVSEIVKGSPGTLIETRKELALVPNTCCICAHLVRGLAYDPSNSESRGSKIVVEYFRTGRSHDLNVRTPLANLVAPIVFRIDLVDGKHE